MRLNTWMKRAKSRAATTMSPASAMLQPPPAATPLTTTTTGTPAFSNGAEGRPVVLHHAVDHAFGEHVARLQVLPGAEAAARAGQHQAAHRRVGRHLGDRAPEFAEQMRRHRVQGRRVVQRQDAHRAVAFALHSSHRRLRSCVVVTCPGAALRYVNDGRARSSSAPFLPRELAMSALDVLFSTDYGLMSVAVIVFMLGMGVFFTRFFLRKMDEDAAKAKASERG